MFTKSRARRLLARIRHVGAFATAVATCLLLLTAGVALGSAHGPTLSQPFDLVSCPPGEYLVGFKCTIADPGYYSPGGTVTSQTPCAPGTYADSFGNSSCTLAPAGSYAAGPAATGAVLCPAGTYTSDSGHATCLDAPAGSYAAGTGNIGVSVCARGSYQPSTGQSSCILASKGYYVPSSGATLQIQCPDFQTTSATGASSCRSMTALERLVVLKTYVTGKDPGSYLRRHVAAARTALIQHDLHEVRWNLNLVKARARAESGHILTAAQTSEIIREANAILAWRVPILGYHWTVCPADTVPEASRYLYVCPGTFHDELQLLLDNGWTFITGAEFAAAIEAGAHPPPKTAVITIDGTEAGDHDVAFPILADLGIRATFFISPGLLGLPGNQTWTTVEEMAAAGQDVENHGMFHRTMTKLHGAALAAEVRDASDALRAHLGYRPSVFCYPNGAFNEKVRTAVATTPGIKMAVYTESVLLEDSANPMEVHRLSVRGEYTPADLLAMVTPYVNGR